MTTNRMHRRRARRARAVRHCLDRYHQQARIEEELRALLTRSDSPQVLYFCPLLTLHGLVVRICGAGGPVLRRR